MDRRYSANSPYTTAPTERFDAATTRIADGRVGYADPGSPVEDYPAYEDYPYGAGYDSLRDTGYDTDYRSPDESDDDSGDGDYAEYEHEPLLDRRWMFIAGVAGAILLVAVICTVVILGGGDSGSVTATVVPPPQTSQPATTAAPPAATSPPTSLPAETVTTVTPSPSATAAAPESPPPPAAAAPPPPAPSPRAVTYQVTGNRPLLDLVTVIYTDHQGALQTELNVALPWTKTVVLDPGVELKSVTATSVTGQLNCAITDAAGATLASQAANTMIATCTQ
ncbi:hypothetical protein H7I41_01935 [Mycobacterium manitobense]|uniref:MmpS3 protein n=1 Tax=[Mycobacterium] manitobense TaxID=190147 RepID=A0A9X3BL93_9MYCO|nr:hypothetical protein [[Mycobacterium] manitobense]MCV7168675.1 hypothetical protein [[Mycobacterium] manitobense]